MFHSLQTSQTRSSVEQNQIERLKTIQTKHIMLILTS